MRFEKIIFICSGNTCRSPMAEFIMKKETHKNPLFKDVQILSRGLAVCGEQPMNPKAEEVLELNDVPFTAHSSSPLMQSDLDRPALLLTMTCGHKQFLEKALMPYRNHIQAETIKAFAGEQGDVADPYGFPAAAYDRCFWELSRLIEKIIIRLLKEEVQ